MVAVVHIDPIVEVLFLPRVVVAVVIGLVRVVFNVDVGLGVQVSVHVHGRKSIPVLHVVVERNG